MNLYLTVPGFTGPVGTAVPNFNTPATSTLGYLVSQGLNIAFLIATFLLVIWAFIGTFKIITSQGNKEALAKAKAQLTWAFIGFFVVMISFAVKEYTQDIFNKVSENPVQQVREVKD